MPKVFVTRAIPQSGIEKLKDAGFRMEVSAEDRVLGKSELVARLRTGRYDAVLCLLTDTIDDAVFEAAMYKLDSTAIEAMKKLVKEKLQLFGSVNRM